MNRLPAPSNARPPGVLRSVNGNTVCVPAATDGVAGADDPVDPADADGSAEVGAALSVDVPWTTMAIAATTATTSAAAAPITTGLRRHHGPANGTGTTDGAGVGRTCVPYPMGWTCVPYGPCCTGGEPGVDTGLFSAASAACANSRALPYRCAGSLAMPLAMTSSSPTGTPAAHDDGRGGSANMCPAACCSTPSPSNGRRAVRHSNSTQANAYTSARWSTCPVLNRSGAM